MKARKTINDAGKILFTSPPGKTGVLTAVGKAAVPMRFPGGLHKALDWAMTAGVGFFCAPPVGKNN